MPFSSYFGDEVNCALIISFLLADGLCFQAHTGVPFPSNDIEKFSKSFVVVSNLLSNHSLLLVQVYVLGPTSESYIGFLPVTFVFDRFSEACVALRRAPDSRC